MAVCLIHRDRCLAVLVSSYGIFILSDISRHVP